MSESASRPSSVAVAAGRPSPAVWLLIALLALATFAIGLLTPPYQSPDSLDHLRRAAAIADGQWTLTTPPGQSSGVSIDTGLQAHMELYEPLFHHPELKVEPGTAAQARAIPFSGRSEFVVSPGTRPYAPLVYVLHAAAWRAGQALGLTVEQAFRLVAVTVLAACLAVTAAAFRVLPPTPLIFVLLAMPMTLFQFGSPTIDGICTALLLLWLALYLRGLDSVPEKPALTEDMLLVVLAAVLITCRFHLWPLLLLLAHRAWLRRSIALGMLTLACAVAVATWTVWAMSSTVDSRITRPHTVGYVMWEYLTHPGELLRVLMSTAVFRTPGIARGFVGMLGWYDAAFKIVLYPVFAALMVLVFGLQWRAASTVGLSRLSPAQRQAALLMGAGAVLSALTVVAALLLSWSPFPTETIKGMQGRYFLPAALMLAAAGWGLARPRARMLRRAWIVAVAFLAFSTVMTGWLLVERYSPDAPSDLRIMSPGNEIPA